MERAGWTLTTKWCYCRRESPIGTLPKLQPKLSIWWVKGPSLGRSTFAHSATLHCYSVWCHLSCTCLSAVICLKVFWFFQLCFFPKAAIAIFILFQVLIAASDPLSEVLMEHRCTALKQQLQSSLPWMLLHCSAPVLDKKRTHWG